MRRVNSATHMGENYMQAWNVSEIIYSEQTKCYDCAISQRSEKQFTWAKGNKNNLFQTWAKHPNITEHNK